MLPFCVTMLSTKSCLKFIWSLIQSLSLHWIIFPSESFLFTDSFPLQAFMLIIQHPFGARISEVAPINFCSELPSSSNLDQFVNLSVLCEWIAKKSHVSVNIVSQLAVPLPYTWGFARKLLMEIQIRLNEGPSAMNSKLQYSFFLV